MDERQFDNRAQRSQNSTKGQLLSNCLIFNQSENSKHFNQSEDRIQMASSRWQEVSCFVLTSSIIILLSIQRKKLRKRLWQRRIMYKKISHG